MIDVLIFFIGASLLLYVLLGGSDYGAGILELLPAGGRREAQKHVINEAMGPVWEANHIWLILVIVVLFVGFPTIFTTLMVALHIPMLALLVGIVVRGTAFTFRHYDAIQAPASQRVYTVLFGVSSLWSALWLGIIVASLGRGLIDTSVEAAHELGPWGVYVAPWWGAYPLVVGLFVACIFVFLACVYLIDETEDAGLKRRFTRCAAVFNCAVIVAGGGVFAASYGERESLPSVFFRNPLTLGVMALATLLFVALWMAIWRRNVLVTRIVAGGQVTLILLGWWLLYAPVAVLTAGGPLSFYAEAAPPAVLLQLVIALLAGSCFIFPSLVFLLRVFKRRLNDAERS
ncbi:cytochrome d ubiquinol oxidase subunit II [Opitutaceae bacterium TAV4]|nr:cytochrome d ubiquinol oxidase subunit II [Opitutaceae bacterium TAV4]RRJ98382.1 cytochrome d ubiquinol oxidase subunit II [Opitutaceae bacterium TAV3]